ncbi:hypothetical protein [Gorillibacterium sp. CAU 1737]|uniref:hypothetical protein n=1 Tax=Gorillibacterium sp. CAU 1737 TaxID=3140362 RepID=UPI003260E166
MKRLARLLFAAYLALFLTVSGAAAVHAELDVDGMRELLQKSLTVTEIDTEISRIEQEQGNVKASIVTAEEQMKVQEKQVDRSRERLGRVLRAYYKGERESLWLLIFRAKSFSQMLSFYDYLSYLYRNDKLAFTQYRDEYNRLMDAHQKLALVQLELENLKTEFIHQKERLLALQNEIDRRLEDHPEAAEVLAREMNAVQTRWKEQGLPLFQRYFSSMSEAMQKLPNRIVSDKEKRFIKGTTLSISDQDLTKLLLEEKPDLKDLTLHFMQGMFQAEGEAENLKATITGHYTVEEDPNRLQFHVDKLEFDGFVLDETTRRQLQEKYDLSFMPGLVLPMLHAKEVAIEQGTMTIKFQIKF